MSKIELLIKKLNELPFSDKFLSLGGCIYAVGGIVRDACLDKQSKDFDIMVTGIEFNTLIELLKEYGKVDLVGESFGIIKFKIFGETEDIDISLPRKETATGERGHKAFEVTTDPFLNIEIDLSRRDLTMNSIAIDSKGNVIDPFNGLKDIENKVVRMTNPDTFFDDPLRMLRAVAFASRFDFIIDETTLSIIRLNAERLNEISPERILIELSKIVEKGNPVLGAQLLIESGLSEIIFKAKPWDDVFSMCREFKKVKTLGEFIFLLAKRHTGYHSIDISLFFLSELKGDIKTGKEINALKEISQYEIMSGYNLIRNIMVDAFKIYPDVINTEIYDDIHFVNCINDFKNGTYPKSLKELNFKGSDAMELGYTGQSVGQLLNRVMRLVINGTISNSKESFFAYEKYR